MRSTLRSTLLTTVAAAAAVTLTSAPQAASAPAAPLVRAVCDGKNQPAQSWDCGTAFAVTRAEGAAATGVKDVDDAYTWLGELSSFYGAVGGDFQAMLATDVGGVRAVNVTVRACASDCARNPWPTYYSAKRVIMSTGLMSDDTFAHEFTHGVQDHFGVASAGATGEVGAVREGVANVLGELFDLSNSTPDTTNRWKMGDGSPYGVYRDMDDPTLRRMPDRKGGQYWSTTGNSTVNAAVVDKAGFLIAQGQTFNGQSITGIGLAKSTALWFRTIATMPNGSNFRQLAATLKSVCSANASSGLAGTTTADCAQVAKAITATRLDA